MIAKQCFTSGWIKRQRERYPKTDPYLIEKQLAAFELLGLLTEEDIEFVFKGGTSLILLLPEARRLSIDLDILGRIPLSILKNIVGKSIFNRVEEEVRKPGPIPKKHYKFYFTSVVDGRESYILLDVVDAEPGYSTLQEVQIQSPLFKVEKEVSVTIPTVDGITGDKLTVFAPSTIGISYGRGKSMEIIKQLFDIGELFDHCSDITEIRASYKHIASQEIDFRGLSIDTNVCLKNTFEAAFLLSQANFKGARETDGLAEMKLGIKQMTNYFLGDTFTFEQARTAASKTALLATLVRKSQNINLDDYRFTKAKINEIRDLDLDGEYQILNKLKGANPEAFFYWSKTVQLLDN